MRKRTDVLEQLVLEMYVRGLSTRDIEDALREIGEDQPLLSRSSVSRLSETLWEEYEAFAQRDLGGYDVVYLSGHVGHPQAGPRHSLAGE